jgi:hypothetical protein
LKHVTLLGPIDAFEEAVEGTACFMQLWMVGCLGGVEKEEGLTLVVGVLVVSLEAK